MERYRAVNDLPAIALMWMIEKLYVRYIGGLFVVRLF